MCFSGYITASSSVPSRSGLYFSDLPGCTLNLLDDLVKSDQNDSDECFEYLYNKAQIDFKIDLQRELAGRFHIDRKLLTRETSKFLSDFNTGSELAGVKISIILPKYGKVHILSIGVDSEIAKTSPDIEFYIYQKDLNGELLSTIFAELTAGKNTVQVYEQFEESELFIGYDPASLSLKQTQNLYYPQDSGLDSILCEFPCLYSGELGSVQQINGGGLNVKFIVECSMDKFICENIPLFQHALWYRLGLATMQERITTANTNVSSVLTEDRAKELIAVFNEDYKAAMKAATMNIRMTEDPICFICKRTVGSKINLP